LGGRGKEGGAHRRILILTFVYQVVARKAKERGRRVATGTRNNRRGGEKGR